MSVFDRRSEIRVVPLVELDDASHALDLADDLADGNWAKITKKSLRSHNLHSTSAWCW